MLTERQLLILQTIIDDFIETAKPIGSRALSKKDEINLSAATIRNVMADLEEMELLEKTHTSSGRVPSEKGYRYYVDNVISPTFNQTNMNVIKHMLQDNIMELEQIVQMSADILSQMTNYTAIILGPNVTHTTLKQIQIVTISPTNAVAILVTNTGHVEHRNFSIPAHIDPADLEKIVNILNDKLIGVPIRNIGKVLQNEVYDLMRKHLANYEHMYEYMTNVMHYDEQAKFYVGGQANMLRQPEFNDVEKIYNFYAMLENEAELSKLLSTDVGGLQILIGKENKNEAIKNLSLIKSSYQLGNNQYGTIALIGPTRMEYRKVMTLLQALTREMTDILSLRDDE